MCPWVGAHAPSFRRQLWGLPSRVEYLSPQGVLLPLVYGTTASPLWLELRGLSAWQATPFWTVYRLACQWLLPWLRVTFAMVPDAAWPGSDQWPWGTVPAAGPVGRLGRPSASDPWGVGSFLSLAPYMCTCVWCPGPLGSCSPVCPLGALFCLCGVLGHLAPVHRCARSVCCVACAVSWAPWILFTGVPAWFVVLRVRCPGPLGSCSPMCSLGMLFCLCGVLGHLAPVHRCAHSVCCFACAVSWATWPLFTGVPAWFAVLRVRCSGPLGSCSPLCPLRLLPCVRRVLGHLAPVHRCARSVCYVACAVSWANWLPFTGASARFAVLGVRCPGPLGSCSPVRPLGLSCCVYGVLGPLALFTSVPARCVVVRVRCPGPLGSCSPVRPLGLSCCVYGVLGPLALVHRCARSVCCGACAVSWATLVPVHRCARSVCRVACTVSWAPWLLFTGVPARFVVLFVRCPGPLASCSPVRPLGLLCCVYGVLGPLAPVHRCARSMCCVACAVSWAPWLLFTGVPARCVVLRVRCPWPLGSCSPVRPHGLLCCAYGVLAPWLLFTGVWCCVLRVRGGAAGRTLVHPDGGCS